MNGQLTPKEREFLYETVVKHKPKICLEVGTWKGGGSTWQIVKALEYNGFGVLYTCETEKEFFDEAYPLYRGNNHIRLYNQTSHFLINEMIRDQDIPDFIFFDGPEDESTAVEDFLQINSYLRSGCVFTMHDYDPPSIKAKKMRPFLESLPLWRVECILTAPESVGLVKAVKL